MSWNKAIHTTILGAFRPIRGHFVLGTFLTLKRFKSNKFYMCKISSIASSQLAHKSGPSTAHQRYAIGMANR